jgi:clan AA aspartic protease (TIGR02281 family)
VARVASTILYRDDRQFFELPSLKSLLFGILLAIIAAAGSHVVAGFLQGMPTAGPAPVSYQPPQPPPVVQPPPVFQPPPPAVQPPTVFQPRAGGFSIKADSHHQFVIEGTVSGGPKGPVTARWLVDSGASGIVLTQDIARRLGLRGLRFTEARGTANGEMRAALTRLKTLEVGGVTIRDVVAEVSGGDLDINLLGAPWIALFDVHVADDVMTLWPKRKG